MKIFKFEKIVDIRLWKQVGDQNVKFDKIWE